MSASRPICTNLQDTQFSQYNDQPPACRSRNFTTYQFAIATATSLTSVLRFASAAAPQIIINANVAFSADIVRCRRPPASAFKALSRSLWAVRSASRSRGSASFRGALDAERRKMSPPQATAANRRWLSQLFPFVVATDARLFSFHVLNACCPPPQLLRLGTLRLAGCSAAFHSLDLTDRCGGCCHTASAVFSPFPGAAEPRHIHRFLLSD